MAWSSSTASLPVYRHWNNKIKSYSELTTESEWVQAIAQWDYIDSQIITAPTKIGVVAFHLHGIEKVEFYIDDVLEETVTSMTYNSESDLYEYFITLDPADYADGNIILHAIAYPNVGDLTRTLEDLPLCMNDGGSISPHEIWIDGNAVTNGTGAEISPHQTMQQAFASIGGNTYDYINVYLADATYDFSGSTSAPECTYGWLTFLPAAGATKAGVIIECTTGQTNRILSARIRMQGLTLNFRDDGWQFSVNSETTTNRKQYWLDDVRCIGHETVLNGSSSQQSGVETHRTNVTHDDMESGHSGAGLCRNCTFNGLYADATQNVYRVFNLIADVNDKRQETNPEADLHSDLYQTVVTETIRDNVILLNIQAYDVEMQGLFFGQSKNSAFVNISMDLSDRVEGTLLSQLGETLEHILVWYCSFPNQSLRYNAYSDDPEEYRGVDMKRSIFKSISSGSALLMGESYHQDMHYVEGNEEFGVGTDSRSTEGAVTFADRAGKDLRLTGSVMYDRITELPLYPTDCRGNVRPSTGSSIGAYE